MIVTVAFGLACASPAGVCEITRSSCVGSVVSVNTIFTLKPATSSVVCAVALSRLITSGTVNVGWSLRHLQRDGRVLRDLLVAGRDLVDDLVGGPVGLDAARVATAKPAACSCCEAWSY